MYLNKGCLCYVFVTFFSLSFANDDADVCGDMPVIPHTTIDTQGKKAPFVVGFRTRFRCVEGYISGGKLLYLRCLKKEEIAVWHFDENPCRARSCGYPGEVGNAIRSGHIFSFPNNVTYVCKEGFKLKGTPIVPCLHTGHWGTPFPTCEEIGCPLLPYLQNGQVRTTGLHYGNTATYECDIGYTLEGPNQRICTEDAQWNGEAPLCKASTCSPPAGLTNVRVLYKKDVYYYRDQIIFICHTKGEFHSSRCLRNGIWSVDPPACPDPPPTTTVKTEPPSSSSTSIIKTETPSISLATSTVKTESSPTSPPAVSRTEPSDSSATGIVETGVPSPSQTTVETEAAPASTGDAITERASSSIKFTNAKSKVSSTSSTTVIAKTGPPPPTAYCPVEMTTADKGGGSKFTWPKTLHGTETSSVPPCLKEDSSPFLRSCLKNSSDGDAYWEYLDVVCNEQGIPDRLGHDCAASDDRFVFQIITYIGCGFSILVLALIVLTFLLFREWREEDKNKILFNLCTALLVVLVILLACFETNHSGTGSRTAVVFLHYFLLATFAWTLVEAVVHYQIVVKDRLKYIRRIMMISLVCAWGSPLLIVSLLMVFNHSAYGGLRNSCWNFSADFSYPLAIPVGAMLIITFVMHFLILCSLSCGPHGSITYDMNGKQQHIKRLQTSVCISVLLGLSCIFGSLAMDNTRRVFHILFVLSIALEGLFIFVNSVLRERTTLEMWKDLLFRSRQNRISPLNDLNCRLSMLQIMKEQNV